MSEDSSMKAALGEFYSECEEIYQRVTGYLNSIEKGEQQQDLVDAFYRDIHTMKGSAQLFGFQQIGRVSHAIEASLNPIRRLNLKISEDMAEAIYQALDLIDQMLKKLRKDEKIDDLSSDIEHSIVRLVDSSLRQFKLDFSVLNDAQVFEDDLRSVKGDMEQLGEKGKLETKTEEKTMAAEATSTASISTTSSTTSTEQQSHPEVVESQQGSKMEKTDSNSAGNAVAQDSTVRVQVGLLDRLMNLVGELVLVRNQVLQYLQKNDNLEFLNLSKSLDVVTSELQSEVMRTRMQPIANVVGKFQRVVRDLGKELGKNIDLTIQGAETELDKTLLEAVRDPLTHIVRNSCDHGIETVEERRKAGKPETGHVFIRSYHEGGQVVIEVSDDGKGLDKARIVEKAIEKGILKAEKASQLSEQEIFKLIFLPGFSTAKQVSSVSGRGVGMDVVKTNIEKIGGTIDLSSVLGKGTSIRLKIPLTLAIVPAMIVNCGGEKFAIPQIKLVELVMIESGSTTEKIEYLQGKPVYRLRGTLLPLIRLDEVLKTKRDLEKKSKEFESPTNIVVLNADGEYFGLVVDEILDTADIVVKPLSRFLKTLSIFSGATIMGDGSVALILDVNGIAKQCNIKHQNKDNAFVESSLTEQSQNADAQEFLLFNLDHQSLHAVPLCLVQRLEEFSKDQIEASGDSLVVRYRGSILPIISLNKTLKYVQKPVEGAEPPKNISVIVVQKSGHMYGIQVNDIQDIVVINGEIDDSVRDREEILGNVVFQDEVIVVVDALGIVERATRHIRAGGEKQSASGSSGDSVRMEQFKNVAEKKKKVLLAEDVAFFRKHVSKVLIDAGYDVVIAEDGKKAMQMMQTPEASDVVLVVSDIEMPNMNGLELAREIRKMSRSSPIPMIALTTRYTDRDIEAGYQAGFNLYLEKLNPDKLLSGVRQVLEKGNV